MALGPIQMVVLGFPDSTTTAGIRPAIADLVERNIVQIVDALVIAKDDGGAVTVLEIENAEGELAGLAGQLADQLDLVSAEDVEELGADLAPGSSALVLIFEHTWMRPVREAVVAAGGVLLGEMFIPPEVVDEVLAAVESV